jgi:hypothetical protein
LSASAYEAIAGGVQAIEAANLPEHVRLAAYGLAQRANGDEKADADAKAEILSQAIEEAAHALVEARASEAVRNTIGVDLDAF